MRAIRLAYPLPRWAATRGPWAGHAQGEWEMMRNAGMIIDFPDRKVSYALFCWNKSDVPRYAAELRKAVDLQSPGKEPAQLEIRASD